jgi:hypothetical protein
LTIGQFRGNLPLAWHRTREVQVLPSRRFCCTGTRKSQIEVLEGGTYARPHISNDAVSTGHGDTPEESRVVALGCSGREQAKNDPARIFFPRGNRRRPNETVARTEDLKKVTTKPFGGGVMKRIRLISSILTLSIAGLTTSLQAQVKFKFVNISVPNATETDAYAIDNKNLIAGDYINAAGQQVGMFMKGSKVTSVSCPGGGPTMFTGVNSGGSAAAEADDDAGSPAAGAADGDDEYCGNGATIWILLHHGSWTSSPIVDAIFTEAIGINDLDQVVGVFEDANEMVHGFLLDLNTGAFTQLDVPGASSTGAWGINNAGTITLQSTDAAGNPHSYLYSGGTYTLIDVPNAVQSFVHDINNNGDIVYTVEDANGFSWGVFFYATLQEIYWFNQPDGRDNTRAYGINDEVEAKNGTISLKIVGEYTPPSSTQNLAYEGTITIKP